MGRGQLRFEILGAVRAWRGDDEVPLGPRQQRSLLALLLVRAGQPVSLDALVGALWADEPPHAVNVVYRQIGNLRRVFEPGLPARASGSWLLPDGDGYRMALDEASLDLLRFRALVTAARRAGPDSAGEQARLFAEAIELSQGPVADGVDAEVRSRPAFAAVEYEFLDAVRAAADAALHAGSPRRVIARVHRLAEEKPLDEALQAQLMLLLTADGRQAEALQVFHELRRHLADELGVQPGAAANAAMESILRPARAGVAPLEAPPDATPHPRPAQLPATIPAFTERPGEVAGILALAGDTDAATGAIGTIVGMPGIGKTTLAIHCAHRLADRFPDGQLFLNLRGFGPDESVTTPAQALHHLLESFGVTPQRMPVDLDMRAALYRSLVSGRRVLIVLDNARDADHVRPLLPGSPTCFTIVTSRTELTDLIVREGAHPTTVTPLPDSGSRDLLTRRLGAARLTAEPSATAKIIQACAGLPLALSILAARAAVRPAFPLSAIAGELAAEQGNLRTLGGLGEATDPAVLFSWSYRALSTGAARLFRLLGLVPGPTADRAAAACLADLDEEDARTLLDELTRAHLVTETRPDRFALHDLIRSYAAQLAAGHEPETERRAALHRLLNRYYHPRVVEAMHGLGPSSTRYFAGRPQAAAWLAAERAALLAAVASGSAEGLHDVAARLAESLDPYLDMSGRREDRVTMQRIAVEAAQLAGDDRAKADSLHNLGLAEYNIGRLEAALQLWRESVEFSRAAGDVSGEAKAYRNIAAALNTLGRWDESIRYRKKGIALLRDLGGSGLSNALNGLGYTYALIGELTEARRLCLEALDELETERMPERTRAAILDSLGYIEHHSGNLDEAADYYGQAVASRRALDDRYPQAMSLLALGQVAEDNGDTAAATGARNEARAILEDLDHPDAANVPVTRHT